MPWPPHASAGSAGARGRRTNGRQLGPAAVALSWGAPQAWATLLGGVAAVAPNAHFCRATASAPGGLQNAVEMIADFIKETAASIFRRRNDLIAPMASPCWTWKAMAAKR